MWAIQRLAMLNMISTSLSLWSTNGFDGAGAGESGGGQDYCPEQNHGPVVFTVIPSPPYSINATGITSDVSPLYLGMLSILFEQCSCLSKLSAKINVVASRNELEKTVKATNKTDFGFPLFLPGGSKTVFKKSYHAFSSHPGFDLFAIPEITHPGQVCVDTLVSSWPLLALSVIFTGMAGIAIWICETLHNPDEFPKSFTRGSWEGFWWAFISMTTVGYGDKCPRSIIGRCFAVIWIFAGLIVVSVFMANVTTALTSATQKNKTPRLEEMDKVGVLKNSIEEGFAKEKGTETESFTSFEDLLLALKEKNVDGILVDRFVMGYHLENLTDPGDLTRVKQYPGSSYSVGAVANNQHAKSILDACFPQDYFTEPINQLNQSMTAYGIMYVKKGYSNLKPKPTSDPKSFNLFIESKEALEKATYISCGVLAALVAIGLFLDITASKKRRVTTGEHELRLSDFDQILQDIQKGKEMLNNLGTFLQEIEDKVKKQRLIAPRYYEN